MKSMHILDGSTMKCSPKTSWNWLLSAVRRQKRMDGIKKKGQ